MLYCATDKRLSITTVSYGQYITHDSTSISADGCSVYHKLQDAKDVGWITISTKHNYIEERKRW
jgi:hypothetical protein